MINLTGWSLFVDIALTCSLVYLAYRLTKAESVAVKIDRVGDLEKSLHKIIKESQEASYELEDKLRSRQRELTMLLSDLRDVEERVTGNFDKSTAIKLSLDKDLEAGERLIQKINSILKLGKMQSGDITEGDLEEKSEFNYRKETSSLDANLNDNLNAKQDARVNTKPLDLVEELKSDLEYEIDNPRKKAEVRHEKQYVVSEKYAKNDTSASLMNAPISHVSSSHISSSRLSANASSLDSSLSHKIEKEVVSENQGMQRKEAKEISKNQEVLVSRETAKERALKAKNLEQSYDLAEAMIKRGMTLEDVALKTNLSLNDVKKIAKIALMNGGYNPKENVAKSSSLKIEKENTNENSSKILTSTDDERLGVLSKMRRERVML